MKRWRSGIVRYGLVFAAGVIVGGGMMAGPADAQRNRQDRIKNPELSDYVFPTLDNRPVLNELLAQQRRQSELLQQHAQILGNIVSNTRDQSD